MQVHLLISSAEKSDTSLSTIILRLFAVSRVTLTFFRWNSATRFLCVKKFQIKRIYCPWCPDRVAQKSHFVHDFVNNAGRYSKKHQASRGFSAIAELLVSFARSTASNNFTTAVTSIPNQDWKQSSCNRIISIAYTITNVKNIVPQQKRALEYSTPVMMKVVTWHCKVLGMWMMSTQHL